MADELTSVIEMFHSFKKSGRSATLTMSTKGGQATKVKLEVELDDATPPSSSPSSTSTSTAPSLPGCQATGDRHRPHGSARRRAKANARAAQHRVFKALPFPEGFSDAQSLPGPPPSRRPLQHHPSPTVEGRRKILTVKKPAGCQPTFATLNLDGAPPPTTPLTTPPTLSHPSPPSSPPPPPLHISRQPPLCQAWYDHGHCKYCGRCSMLCVDHHGCYCEEEGVVHCDVCHCTKELRHLAPS